MIKDLSPAQLGEALNQEVLPELWPRALQCYTSSGSFRSSEGNFRDLIIPFSGKLHSDQIEALLVAVISNDQNWDASGTPALLNTLLKNTAPADLPLHQSRDRFFHFLAPEPNEVFMSLSRVYSYEEVIERLKADGWTPSERAEKSSATLPPLELLPVQNDPQSGQNGPK